MQIWQRDIRCRSLNPRKYSVVHLVHKACLHLRRYLGLLYRSNSFWGCGSSSGSWFDRRNGSELLRVSMGNCMSSTTLHIGRLFKAISTSSTTSGHLVWSVLISCRDLDNIRSPAKFVCKRFRWWAIQIPTLSLYLCAFYLLTMSFKCVIKGQA